jgi:acyl-coenzyme A thioesterase PaaI-like protein
MKKIRNPFTKYPDYKCFGCSPDNPFGLKMTFVEVGEEIHSVWDPSDWHQGYFQVLHGGIQATLMDEIASWVVYVRLKTAGFTSKAEIRYRKTVYVNQGPVKLIAKCISIRRNLADIQVRLINSEGVVAAEGVFTYFTYPPEKASDNLYYPGAEEFYE